LAEGGEPGILSLLAAGTILDARRTVHPVSGREGGVDKRKRTLMMGATFLSQLMADMAHGAAVSPSYRANREILCSESDKIRLFRDEK
jgi:hypothetical protein